MNARVTKLVDETDAEIDVQLPTRVERAYTAWQSARYNWGFLAIHLAVLAVFFVGVSWPAVITCLGLYWLRVLFITGFYHRYFQH